MLKISDILLSPKKAKRHPFEIIFVGFFYASLSILLSYWIFPSYASLLMIFFTVIACLYMVEGIFIVEEKKEKNTSSETTLLKEHTKTLIFLLLLFLGFLFAFTFWEIILPEKTTSVLFLVQQTSIPELKTITGNSVSTENFSVILYNNLRVLLLSLLFAFFYGAGAIFILAWNASIMGFVIGNLAKNTLGIASLPLAFMKFFLHGIPEMLAYFAAALAGGILFMSIIRGEIYKDKMKRIAIDFFVLIIISVILLLIAALIETYISPNI
jgi:stage II sporulation protein M